MPERPEDELARRTRATAGVAALLGAGFMHLIAGWAVVASATIAPLWAVAAFSGAWVVGLVLVLRWWRARPLAALLVPFATGALMAAAVQAGVRSLGWEA